ncbi:MAG TPA: sigma-70 family RNA polymerase sigma factor [Planctomycetota bacterium]|nr:sigma-70 family RNA polymerase sigma factor [Planctomycetota bacterium]
MTTDAAWIEAAVARYERPLIAYARRILSDDDRARDVVQDTFLRLCRQSRGEVEHRLVEWLFTVVRHVSIDRLRKERPMSAIADREFSEAAPPPSARMEQQEAGSGLLGALASLPRNQQDCIRLKFQQGLSYQQISGVTGLSVSNIGFLIHTGIKSLRARLTTTTASTDQGVQP